jgi:hypothetical protein
MKQTWKQIKNIFFTLFSLIGFLAFIYLVVLVIRLGWKG